jgi:glucose/arabinose dehydrogenase
MKICIYGSKILPVHVIFSIFVFAALVIFTTLIICFGTETYSVYAQENKSPNVVENNARFDIERVFTGINGSTNMAFIDENDILVLEKNTGRVDRIVNGSMLDRPLIDVNSFHQDGLVGIASTKYQNDSIYVFLYFTESPLKYGGDVNDWEEAKQVNSTFGYDREGNRLYRYELIDNKFVNPELLMDLKFTNQNKHLGAQHNGGEVVIGPDKAVYVIIGDLDGWKYHERTKVQNYQDGTEPDGRAGILRVTQDGKAVGKGILGNTYPLNLYYAYGIRNSFGMDFDPVTGNLWDTENGPDCCDEINLVKPGFNSGSSVLEGMSTVNNDLYDLVDFNGKGKYSEPEFVWNATVAPTAIKFFNSDKFGNDYKNDIFVADYNHGNIYHFDLNDDRTELSLANPLEDKVANTQEEVENNIFAKGFRGITDLQVGPDGNLYVLSDGKIFRIVPKDQV